MMTKRIIRDVIGIFVLIFILTSKVKSQEPDITERILPEIKRIGVTGRLRCVVINQQTNPVSWVQKSSGTTISTDDKIKIDESLNTVVNGWPKYQVDKSDDGQKAIYTLIINRLEPRDAGNYTCQVMVRGSTRFPSKDGEMVVLIPPAIERARTTHTISVKQGDAVNLTCSATGFPTPNITWVRINGDLLPGGELKHRSPVYTINPVTSAARGIYRCLADNNVRPPATNDATLLVLFRPEAKAIQDTYGQAQSRMFDVTIECRVSGYPEPDLKWYKTSLSDTLVQIRNDDKHTINILLNHANILNPNERWLQLVIRSVQANDYGHYICEGRNNLGSGNATVTLFETSECQGPNCPAEQSFNAAPLIVSSSIQALLVSFAIILLRNNNF